MDGQRRTSEKPAWQAAFLSALAVNGNVYAAAKAADCSRSNAYETRNADPAFAAAWDSALEEAADRLELEAVRRAHDGVNEPVIHQGQLMGIWVDENGDRTIEGAPGAKMVPLTVKKYSDTLLIFLLKGAKPQKFRENVRQEVTGADGGPLQVQSVAPSIRRMMNDGPGIELLAAVSERLAADAGSLEPGHAGA